MTNRPIIALLILSIGAAQTKGPAPADEILASLRSADGRTKAGAAREIAVRPDVLKDPAVRSALLLELEKAVDVIKQRHATGTTVGSEADFEYANVYNALVHATQQLDGDDVLGALLPTIATSGSSRERVAGFGIKAMAPLIALYEAPSGTEDPASERLGIMDTLAKITLRASVTRGDRDRLRALAERALRSKAPPEIAGGMFLGTALREPALIEQIRAMRAAKFQGVEPTRSPRYLEAMAKKAFAQAGVR